MGEFGKKFKWLYISSAIIVLGWMLLAKYAPEFAESIAEAVAWPMFVLMGCIFISIIYGIICVLGKAENVATASKYKRYFKKTLADVSEENIKLLFTFSSKDIQYGEKVVGNGGIKKSTSAVKDMANRLAAEGEAEMSIAVDKETLLPYKVLKFRETDEKLYLKTTYNEMNRCIEMSDEAFMKYKTISQENIKEKL